MQPKPPRRKPEPGVFYFDPKQLKSLTWLSHGKTCIILSIDRQNRVLLDYVDQELRTATMAEPPLAAPADLDAL